MIEGAKRGTDGRCNPVPKKSRYTIDGAKRGTDGHFQVEEKWEQQTDCHLQKRERTER